MPLQNDQKIKCCEFLPILQFLSKKTITQKQYLKFTLLEIKVNQTYASYKIQVQGQGKFWIMDCRYSTLRILYERLQKKINFDFEFPPKKIFGNLEPELLKRRAESLEEFLNKIGSQKQLIQSVEVKQFLNKQEKASSSVRDYNDLDNFNLDE